MASKKKPKPAVGLDGRWFKSKSGRCISYIIVTAETVPGRGDIYKLRSLLHDWVDGRGITHSLSVSSKQWTEAELKDNGRILKNKPSAAMIREAKALPYV